MKTNVKEFSELGYKLIELIARDLQQSTEQAPGNTLNFWPPGQQLAFWESDFNSGTEMAPEILFQQVLDHSIHLNNPGYMGHQVPPPMPLTILTSALVAYLNNGMAVYEMGMAGNAMEQVIIKYFSELWGLPSTAIGIVTSGGTLGNLTCLMAARSVYLAKHGEADYPHLAVLVSAEAHYSVERAFIVMGLPPEQIIKVETDTGFRMKPSDLQSKLMTATSNGLRVFCIIGCACTTATGSFDDLEALADFALQNDIWFHVDAAHGGPTIFSDKYRKLLKGIDKADSVIMDFHKMMHVPSLSTLVLFRSPDHHRGTFEQHASYLWQEEGEAQWYNSGKQTFECTKPMTIFNVYAMLRIYGAKYYQKHIDSLYDMAIAFADLLKGAEDFELLCPPQSNIICFRYKNDTDQPDRLNRFILRELITYGRFYIVSTHINGGFYLRTCIMNPHTRPEHLELLTNTIRSIAGRFAD